MNLLLPLMEKDALEASDPQKIAIQSILEELAGVLQEDFLEFMPSIMAALVCEIEEEVAMKWVKQDEAQKEEADEDESESIQKMVLKVKGVEGNIAIQLNTHALENKLSSVNIIRSLASKLGKHFAQYLDQVASVYAKTLVHDKVASGLRKEATKTLSVLLGCCETQEKMLELLQMFLPEFATEILDKSNPEKKLYRDLKWLHQELARCFKHFYNFRGVAILSETQVKELVALFTSVLDMLKNYKSEMMQQYEAKKVNYTEEDIEMIQEYVQKIDKIWGHIMEICTVLLRTMPEVASPEIQANLVKFYAEILMNVDARQEHELVNALCFLDDCIEYGDNNLFDMVKGQALEKMVEVM